jgi:hypothetical protein
MWKKKIELFLSFGDFEARGHERGSDMLTFDRFKFVYT